MSGLSGVVHLQVMEVFDHPLDLFPSSQMFSVITPTSHSESCFVGDLFQIKIILWADGIFLRQHFLGIGSAIGEDVQHIHSAISPPLSVTDAAGDRGVVHGFGGGAWIQAKKGNPRPSIPEAVESIAIFLTRGKNRPLFVVGGIVDDISHRGLSPDLVVVFVVVRPSAP